MMDYQLAREKNVKHNQFMLIKMYQTVSRKLDREQVV